MAFRLHVAASFRLIKRLQLRLVHSRDFPRASLMSMTGNMAIEWAAAAGNDDTPVAIFREQAAPNVTRCDPRLFGRSSVLLDDSLNSLRPCPSHRGRMATEAMEDRLSRRGNGFKSGGAILAGNWSPERH